MNRAQRVAVLVGAVVVLFAASRALLPFSVSGPRTRGPCGVVAVEAVRGARFTGTTIVLTSKGEADQAAFQAAAESAARLARADSADLDAARRAWTNGGRHGPPPTVASQPSYFVDPIGRDDGSYDHVTYNLYAATPCTFASRRKLLGDGVLAGFAIAGSAVGLWLLADPKQRKANDA